MVKQMIVGVDDISSIATKLGKSKYLRTVPTN